MQGATRKHWLCSEHMMVQNTQLHLVLSFRRQLWRDVCCCAALGISPSHAAVCLCALCCCVCNAAAAVGRCIMQSSQGAAPVESPDGHAIL
jgi:hypothetical protein